MLTLSVWAATAIALFFREPEPREERGQQFLSVPAHRSAWSRFAKEQGWDLELESGCLEGAYGRHLVSVKLPRSYLGGPGEVSLRMKRRLPALHVVPRRWWQGGGAPVRAVLGDAERVPPELQAFLAQHGVALKTSEVGLQCTLSSCEVGVVRELLEHLARLAKTLNAYRLSA